MRKAKKFLSVVLAVLMLLSSVSVSSFAANDEFVDVTFQTIKTPKATFISSGITRVAAARYSQQPGTTIVAATPSGVPELSHANASLAYAGETPAWTTVTLTLDVEPDATPIVTCTNATLSDAQKSGNSYTWTVTGGNATAGSYLEFVATYKYNGKDYENRCYSVVENIISGGLYSLSYIVANTTWTLHRYYAMIPVYTRILGSNVNYELSGTNSVNGYFNFETGGFTAEENAAYKDAYFTNVFTKSRNADPNDNVSYANSPRAIAHVYVDTSSSQRFSDTNTRISAIVGNKNVVNGSQFGADLSFSATATVGGFVDASPSVTNDTTVAAKLNHNFVLSTSAKFAQNSSIFTAKFDGLVSNVNDGDSFTIVNTYKTTNTDSWYYDLSETAYIPTHMTVHKYDKGALRTALDYVMNTATEVADKDLTVGKGINPQSWYYSEGFDAFKEAYKNAQIMMQKVVVSQDEINSATTALYNAYSGLKMQKGNYDRISVLLEIAAVYYENHPSYLEEAFQKLVGVVNSLELNHHILAQPTIDMMEHNMTVATDNMKLVSADYTVLEEALAQKPQYDSTAYTEESYGKWLANKNEGELMLLLKAESVYEQDIVDAKAQSILDDLAALELKSVDKSPLEAAVLLTPKYARENYVEETYTAFENAIDEGNIILARVDLTGLDNQMIKEAAQVIIDAHAALKLKDADTSALEAAVALELDFEEDFYVPELLAAFKEAVALGNAVLAREDLTILDNDAINAAAYNITSAFEALDTVGADYTEFNKAVAAFEEKAETETLKVVTYAVGGVTGEEIVKNYTVDSIGFGREYIEMCSKDLKIEQQAVVNGYVEDITVITELLEETVTFEYLVAAVEEFATLSAKDYTADTWNAYKAAVEAFGAEETQADVNASVEAIAKARLALEEIEYFFEAQEGTTTVIDRDAGFIYGLEEGIVDLEDFVDYAGCELEYTYTDAGFGTGSKVDVMIDGEVIESFYIVIFGDVTGDGYVDAFDVTEITGVANYEKEFEYGSAYEFAGDVTGDYFVDSFDLTLVTAASNYETVIPQTK